MIERSEARPRVHLRIGRPRVPRIYFILGLATVSWATIVALGYAIWLAVGR